MLIDNFILSSSRDKYLTYSGKLLLDLCFWRDKHNSLLGRVTTQLALCGLAPMALIERSFHASRPFGDAPLFKNKYVLSKITVSHSLHALTTNLFVQSITSELIDREVEEYPWLKTPYLLSSAYLNSDYDLAKILATKDWVKPHEVFENGSTRALMSKVRGHPEFNPLFQLNDYEKDYLELMLLSHWLGLKGDVELHGIKLPLEGTHGKWMFESLATAIHEFKESADFKHLKLGVEKALILEEALSSAYTEHSPEKISERVQNGKLCFIDAGWKDHAIGLALYGDYMAVGNRGDGTDPDNSTLEVYKVDSSLLTPEIVKEIESMRTLDLKAGKEYFYKTLPAKLSSSGKIEKDPLCHAFATIAPAHSKGGHCSLAGKKSVFRFAWAMLLSAAPDLRTLQRAELETKLFTDWTAVKMLESVTPGSFTGLKERKEVLAQACSKGNRKWVRLQCNRWRAGISKTTLLDWPLFILRTVTNKLWNLADSLFSIFSKLSWFTLVSIPVCGLISIASIPQLVITLIVFYIPQLLINLIVFFKPKKFVANQFLP